MQIFSNFLVSLRNSSPIRNCHQFNCMRSLTYIQGQKLEPNIREYFYYVDQEGMVLYITRESCTNYNLKLFLDDSKIKNFTSCFKERKFLKFFFSRIKLNDTGRYETEFPFLSLCGRERNFIRCDDLPIVFTHIIKDLKGCDVVSYAHTGDQLTILFEPAKIYMNPESGRVYHPAWPKVGGIGLLRSKLAIELSKGFEFEKGDEKPPTHFTWNGQRLELNSEWVKETIFNQRN